MTREIKLRHHRRLFCEQNSLILAVDDEFTNIMLK